MSEITEKLNEARTTVGEIEKLIERDPNFDQEKPGLILQKFYLAIREVQNRIKELTPDERAEFDELNETFKNLVGAIARKLIS